VETEVKELSVVEKRMGPVFEDERNVNRFLEKCRSRGQKPFIEGGRFWVYAERKIKNVETAIKEFADKDWRAFGKDSGEFSEVFRFNLGRRIRRERKENVRVNVQKFSVMFKRRKHQTSTIKYRVPVWRKNDESSHSRGNR